MIVQPVGCVADLFVPQPAGVQVLHPGDVALGERGERLETLLGSCVAIVLTDPRRTLGAMCHIVHSNPPVAASKSSSAYAGVALDRMYTLLRARGIEPRLCEAYVYGGGNMFPQLFGHGHVGEDNSRWVLAALEQDGIRVLSRDLGGNTYRRLSWTVGTDLPQVVSFPV